EGLRRLLGDHQRVPVAQGIDVEEGEHVVVFVHPVAGELAVEDSREDRGRHVLSFHPVSRAPARFVGWSARPPGRRPRGGPTGSSAPALWLRTAGYGPLSTDRCSRISGYGSVL